MNTERELLYAILKDARSLLQHDLAQDRRLKIETCREAQNLQESIKEYDIRVKQVQ